MSSSGRSKYRWRSKSPGKPIKVCWKWGKEGHFKNYCRYKALEKGKGFDDAPFVEAKSTSDEGGDVYLNFYSSTQVDHEAWLVDSGASFHFTSLREWFYEYEKFDGGDVFLWDDRKAIMIEHKKSSRSCKVGGLEHFRVFYIFLHWPKI